jgi:hypothetical protein
LVKPVSSDSASNLFDFDVSKLKSLKIAILNVNSLLKHIDEIRTMSSDFPFGILAINESKIGPSILYSEISILDYSIVLSTSFRVYSLLWRKDPG